MAEKIYLQLDGKIYTTDKTIWFKSIVTNAADNVPSKLSGVLYVELIGPDEKIIEKKIIKLENGLGDGFFQLNQDYPEGLYLIRAYTEWDRNFDTDFFFKEYIQVFATSPKVKPDPIRNVTLVEEKNNKRNLIAYFDPFLIDSLHKKELTLFLNLDDKKDTLFIKRNDENNYMIDYPLPDGCQFVTMKMQTKNLCSYSKTVVVNEDHLDLQFFPESGELVHGIQSKVGFKALDYNGKSKSIEGEIVNGEGEVVSQFKSNQLGMGSFRLTRVDRNTAYFARLKAQSEERPSNIYPLPAVASQGNVLTIIKNGDEIHVTASSSYLKNDSIYLRVYCRGLVYYEIKGRLKEGVFEFSLASNRLPEGIIAFTMMDSPIHPLAERLYFNERSGNRINISISSDKDTYIQRESTKLSIETTKNNGEAVKANLSVLVFNKDQMGQIQSIRQNILSYFLLSSDLKGEIENPGFYFSKENDHYNDLDALLLTQGWRKYLYTKTVNNMLYQPETKLTVSGTVSGILSQKKKKGIELTMMAFGHQKYVRTQMTDSLGRFNFNINDEYGQNLNILIQSTNKVGENKNYTIVLDKEGSPVISFNHIISIGKVDSIVHKLVEKNIERKKVEDTYKLSGDILLAEVVVEAYRMTPARKKVLEEYGKPIQVISGKAIQKKEEKWSYGLYSVLMFRFPDKIIINRAYNGELNARVRNSEMTLVVIDGIPVNHNDYSLIPNIPPSEVSSFEIIKNAKNFSKLYNEYYPEASSRVAFGDVIAIYTYGGNGIYGAFKPVGIIQAAIPVFSASREFYAPKYKNIQLDDWYKPDLRALIHWEPKLMVDSLGKASTIFYNADIIGEMQVVVEAISDEGEIGYKEMFYDIKKRK
ncbi:MAG: Plug domain-containing protein [Bacteroidetes bacterium]|nr:MAG: Plug domain-containing protein [Bacteroidota bacterium]